MRKLVVVMALLAMGAAAVQADMVAQWTFSGNLNDTATGGSTVDNLVGMIQYAGNGNFDRSFTNYKTDGTTEAIASCVQAPTYEAGVVGSAVRIGARGVYNYTNSNVYPNASTYQVPTTGATFLQTTSDSVGGDLDALNSFTMEGFFKADAIGSLGVENSGLGEFAYTRLITKWVSGFNQNYHFTIHSGKLELIQKNSANVNVTIASTNTLAASTDWCHIAVTGNAASQTISLYFNGDLIGSGAYNGTMYDSTSPFYIGGRLDIPNAISSNNGFIGLVDEVRVWNEAKDAAYMAERANLIPEPATLLLLGLGLLGLKKGKRG